MRLRTVAGVGMAALALSGCRLDEVSIVDVEEVVIAEVYVDLAADPAENEVRGFLHWTVGIDTAGLGSLSDARLTVRRRDGFSLELVENEAGECAESFAPGVVGACFLGDPAQTPNILPGDLLELEVSLPSGGTLAGATRVPAAFELEGLPPTCRLDPDTLLPIRWSRSEGAWAYVNETSIRNLPDALSGEGIVVEEDPLYLLGLSVSETDTDIVFPSEFGVFNRFDLDQAVAVRLQTGLPAGTIAEVSITAVDRSYVNWSRGGNFNPSGQVRVPSLRGDGTGVFASTSSRRVIIVSDPPGVQIPDCQPSR